MKQQHHTKHPIPKNLTPLQAQQCQALSNLHTKLQSFINPQGHLSNLNIFPQLSQFPNYQQAELPLFPFQQIDKNETMMVGIFSRIVHAILGKPNSVSNTCTIEPLSDFEKQHLVIHQLRLLFWEYHSLLLLLLEESIGISGLEYLYLLIQELLFTFRRLLPLVQHLFPYEIHFIKIQKELFTKTGRITGFEYHTFPSVQNEPITVESAGEEWPKSLKQIVRHYKDLRFDHKQFFSITGEEEQVQKLYQQWIDLADGSTLFTEGKIITTEEKQENQTMTMEQKSDLPLLVTENVSIIQTATYPYVSQPKYLQSPYLPSAHPPHLPQNDETLLLNDPNADALLLIRFADCVLGVVADGSGVGGPAYYASNFLCAVVLQKVKQGFRWSTTEQVYDWLLDCLVVAQTTLSAVEQCGATTLILFIMLPTVDGKTALLFAVAGDTEIFQYSASSKQWQSVTQQLNGLRMNTSMTPGGLGKHHGTLGEIYGAFLVPRFIQHHWSMYEQQSKQQYPPHIFNGHFFHHSNNLHFGLLKADFDDFFLFATDGLGDTLHPIQLYPRPDWLPTLRDYQSWTQVNQLHSEPALLSHQLKQSILNQVLIGNTTEQILLQSIRHAKEVTKGQREMYLEPSFVQATKMEKQKILEERVHQYLRVKRNHFVPFAKMDHVGMMVLRARVKEE